MRKYLNIFFWVLVILAIVGWYVTDHIGGALGLSSSLSSH
jgi:hypothetical protein